MIKCIRWISGITFIRSSWKEFCYNLHEFIFNLFFFLHDILRHIKNAQHKGKILNIAHCQNILYALNINSFWKAWRYQRGNQKTYIEEQTKQWSKHKVQKGQTTIYQTQHRKLQTQGILEKKPNSHSFDVIAHMKEQKSENDKKKQHWPGARH